MRRKKTPWVSFAIIVIGSVAMLFPFLDMIFSSFKGAAEYNSLYYRFLPETFQFGNYGLAFESLNIALLFKNSLIKSVVTTVLVLLTSSMAAYALSKLRFRGRDGVFRFILSTMMIPSFLFFIPNFYIMTHFPLVGGNDLFGNGGVGGLTTSILSLILPFAVSAYGIFLMRQFIMTIHNAYLEAARIDGASEFRIYFRLVLPMTGPALATLAIFEFIGQWNEFIWALIINSVNPELAVLPVGVQMLKDHLDPTLTQPLLMAGLVISTVPILIVFIVLQKYYVRGMMNSGLKE
ncbi:carbohydrate ABC transporter permease [Paenibacillus timonensis]|jgi:multiple sugar transport system permease protein|uniref:Carbohydrate ABC transporter permease n=1 Tax=Paenibacillus timonensis TaxID=225915 RepID=A0ABW3SAS4_9BACL|nr:MULTISPECIES: carbohydrate ABC transporter permease [Paenibacillus]MCH1639408.1 carbohydrate ABC transporter permease [Paenibacillus timonensis]MDU2243075.1 carbohydrate ABC transporter permease [Paenibacillus sp.]